MKKHIYFVVTVFILCIMAVSCSDGGRVPDGNSNVGLSFPTGNTVESGNTGVFFEPPTDNISFGSTLIDDTRLVGNWIDEDGVIVCQFFKTDAFNVCYVGGLSDFGFNENCVHYFVCEIGILNVMELVLGGGDSEKMVLHTPLNYVIEDDKLYIKKERIDINRDSYYIKK